MGLTASAAKSKLKSHVARYKHDQGFEVTERHILYWFGVINRAAFRNKLEQPKFVIRRMRGAWGFCEGYKGKVVITLSSKIDNRELFLATLAHEMVHQYQYVTEDKITHTGSFIEWKRFFKRYMNITL